MHFFHNYSFENISNNPHVTVERSVLTRKQGTRLRAPLVNELPSKRKYIKKSSLSTTTSSSSHSSSMEDEQQLFMEDEQQSSSSSSSSTTTLLSAITTINEEEDRFISTPDRIPDLTSDSDGKQFLILCMHAICQYDRTTAIGAADGGDGDDGGGDRKYRQFDERLLQYLRHFIVQNNFPTITVNLHGYNQLINTECGKLFINLKVCYI